MRESRRKVFIPLQSPFQKGQRRKLNTRDLYVLMRLQTAAGHHRFRKATKGGEAKARRAKRNAHCNSTRGVEVLLERKRSTPQLLAARWVLWCLPWCSNDAHCRHGTCDSRWHHRFLLGRRFHCATAFSPDPAPVFSQKPIFKEQGQLCGESMLHPRSLLPHTRASVEADFILSLGLHRRQFSLSCPKKEQYKYNKNRLSKAHRDMVYHDWGFVFSVLIICWKKIGQIGGLFFYKTLKFDFYQGFAQATLHIWVLSLSSLPIRFWSVLCKTDL